MRVLLYLMVASSFLAADVISINISVMELSLYRICLLLLAFILFLEYLKTNKKISLRIKNDQSIMIRFYFFWFIYSLFSIGWVKDYNSWFRAIFFIGSGFLCIWVLSSYVKEERSFKSIFMIILAMLILHNCIGWHELLTGKYMFADLARIDRHSQFGYNPAARVPVSMFGNTNDYATFLVIGIFITYIVLLNSHKKSIKGLSIATIFSSILLIFRTGSRANLLGLIVGLIVLVYMKYFKKISIKTLLIILGIPILILFNPTFIENIFMSISNELQFSFDGGSDYTRLNLIRNGLHFLKETIGFGTGAGNIEYWMATEKLYYVGTIENIHNWWMEILVGYGIIVFIGYVWIYMKMAKRLYHSYLNNNNIFIKNTSLGLLSIMGAFVITSISSSSNIPTEWLWVFWGIVISYIGYVESHDKSEDNKL